MLTALPVPLWALIVACRSYGASFAPPRARGRAAVDGGWRTRRRAGRRVAAHPRGGPRWGRPRAGVGAVAGASGNRAGSGGAVGGSWSVFRKKGEYPRPTTKVHYLL